MMVLEEFAQAADGGDSLDDPRPGGIQPAADFIRSVMPLVRHDEMVGALDRDDVLFAEPIGKGCLAGARHSDNEHPRRLSLQQPAQLYIVHDRGSSIPSGS